MAALTFRRSPRRLYTSWEAAGLLRIRAFDRAAGPLPPRLARRITGIAGGFALGLQRGLPRRLLGLRGGLAGGLLGGLTRRFRLQARGIGLASRLALGRARVARDTGREARGLPLHDDGVVRLRPRPKLLQQRLPGLCGRAHPLVEIVVILEGAHRPCFIFVWRSAMTS